MKADKF
jgi:hypothetical protein